MGNVDGTFDIRTVNVCQRLDYKKDKVWKMDTVCFILISNQKVEVIANFHVQTKFRVSFTHFINSNIISWLSKSIKNNKQLNVVIRIIR